MLSRALSVCADMRAGGGEYLECIGNGLDGDCIPGRTTLLEAEVVEFDVFIVDPAEESFVWFFDGYKVRGIRLDGKEEQH